MSALYGNECASCHGADLEGRPGWRLSLFDTRSAAPPLNGTGYTPQMPDQALLSVMDRGAVYGFGHVGQLNESNLTDSEARALLAWIKTHWPENERRYNERLNRMLSERDD
ncbi:c-type cytochrome [Alloyangia pacifica]|uniref:c-type cytochrome n=1 Tax=Alloyangia pacifica TaxID=311180 RepID=UPI003D2EAFFB